MAGKDEGIEQWEIGDDPHISPDAEVVATAPEQSDPAAIGRHRLGRRVFAVVLTGFLALGLAGVFGVRTRSSSVSGGGYELTVRYAAVTRPGLATPFEIEVSRSDGSPLDEPVKLAVSSNYLAMFDENGLDPGPSVETSTPEAVIWEFEPPGTGDTLAISFDARLEPAVQWGRDGFVQVLEDDQPVTEVRFRTWVTP